MLKVIDIFFVTIVFVATYNTVLRCGLWQILQTTERYWEHTGASAARPLQIHILMLSGHLIVMLRYLSSKILDQILHCDETVHLLGRWFTAAADPGGTSCFPPESVAQLPHSHSVFFPLRVAWAQPKCVMCVHCPFRCSSAFICIA